MTREAASGIISPAFAVACALLVVAGVAKLRSPAPARAALGGAGLRVPAGVVRALGAAEIFVGGWALARPDASAGALVALLYGAFAAFGALSMTRRWEESVPCGCFGDARTELVPAHVILNGIACVVGVAAALTPPPGIGSILDREPLVASTLALGLAATVVAAYLAFTAFPTAWRAYGANQR
jgi:Methylamine utilisation protein MauE